MGKPCETARPVQEDKLELPVEVKGIDNEGVDGERNHAIVHAVRVLQINCGVLDIVTRIEQELSLSIEF